MFATIFESAIIYMIVVILLRFCEKQILILPQDYMRFLMERITTGATMIVKDSLSNNSLNYMRFLVVTVFLCVY